MKHENDYQMRDYDAVLDAKYGMPGTPQRQQFDDEAQAFYAAQIIKDARHEAGLTQAQLAEKVGADKSYISRVEKGTIVPTVTSFYRLLNAMGMQIQIIKKVAIV